MPRPDRVETAMAEGVGLAAEGEAGQEPPNALVHAEDGEDIDRTARTEATNNGVLHRGWRAPMSVEAYKAASDRMRVLLDLLASRPDERLYTEDFMNALGVHEQDFVNGVLGAFGRLTNQRFAPRLPGHENTWPFSVSKDIRSGRWYYEMPSAVADVIKSIDR